MPKANANGIQIEYETFGDSSHSALLLIIGLGAQLIFWQEEFCQQIADAGYYVIRFDNRDSGLSTKFGGLTAEEILEKIEALFMGQKVSVPYKMEDMANDAVGLLDALKIDKAHICGMSMGGMIAQTLVVSTSSRALSLISIYSQCGDRPEYAATQEVMEVMMKPVPKEHDAYIDYMHKFYRLTWGTGLPYDHDFHQILIDKAYERSVYPEGSGRQYLAIKTQKDRTDDLGNLRIPSLVIHGDEDPVVPLIAGQDTADAIPGAEFMVVKGMGHVMPNLNTYWSEIKDTIIGHMGKVQA